MITALALSLLVAQPSPSRRFRIEQTIQVPAQPGVLTLWVPLPHDDAWQTVTVRESAGAEVVKDALGNEAARYSLPAAGGTLRVAYTVERRERAADLAASGKPGAGGNDRWLKDDKLVQVDDKIRALSQRITAEARTPLEKACAIYAYTLANMKYQKTGDGWGNGSIVWACTEKYGNCTDFHALFTGLARAAGIPARFEIGRSVPPDSGEVQGYHCWADFWVDGVGWVPVDASEAWKHPEKRDYFFGHHDDNRFALSAGRDLKLPGMKGAPLNYFVNPYGEGADGTPVKGVTQTTRVTALLSQLP
jgi:transglutaminase-like putative cysteine protease